MYRLTQRVMCTQQLETSMCAITAYAFVALTPKKAVYLSDLIALSAVYLLSHPQHSTWMLTGRELAI